jgi:hypothetical protein
MKKMLIAAAFATTLGAVAVPASAQVYVQIAPPAPRYEVVPAPRAGYVWAEGHWEWNGHRYRWVPGSWMRERPGYVYYSPHWVEHDGRWTMEHRGWVHEEHRRNERGAYGDRDHDGVPNRYDHDRDGDGVPDRYDNHPNDRYRR